MQNSHVISEPYIFEREREHRLSMRDSILFEKLRGTEPLREGEENGREEAGSLRKGGKKKQKKKQKKEKVGSGRQRNKEIN
jgi:hypothetical protein